VGKHISQPSPKNVCHLERSEAESKDLQLLFNRLGEPKGITSVWTVIRPESQQRLEKHRGSQH
jgi:hypothetical protein